MESFTPEGQREVATSSWNDSTTLNQSKKKSECWFRLCLLFETETPESKQGRAAHKAVGESREALKRTLPLGRRKKNKMRGLSMSKGRKRERERKKEGGLGVRKQNERRGRKERVMRLKWHSPWGSDKGVHSENQAKSYPILNCARYIYTQREVRLAHMLALEPRVAWGTWNKGNWVQGEKGIHYLHYTFLFYHTRACTDLEKKS